MSRNGKPMVRRKTGILNLFRSPLRNGRFERILLKATTGRPPRHLMCRIVPNHYQYPRSSMRKVVRHGFILNLDVSDLVQWYVYWDFEDSSHEALISLCRPGDTVLDIGANIGLTALRMSAVIGDGKVFAFEPDPENYTDCLNHIRTNHAYNVELSRIALGSEERLAGLNHAAPGNRGRAWIGTADTKGATAVQVTTVDQFCAIKGLSRVDLIKIDTEGMELAVLKGARRVIERWKPRLFVEVDGHNLERAGDSPRALWNFLTDAGYSIRHAETGRGLESGSDLDRGHFDIVCDASKPPNQSGVKAWAETSEKTE